MTRILLALKEPLLRLGIEAALDQAAECMVVGMATNAADLREQIDACQPDVVILDKTLEQSEPGSMCTLRETFPQVRIIVYVPHGQDECVLRSTLAKNPSVFPREALQKLDCCLVSLRSCARGCVPKDTTARQLVNTIQAVMAGEIAAGPWVGADFTARPAKTGHITPREMEVMRHVARGLSNKAIARRLGMREQTVKNHLSRIARKLGRRTRLELALFAIQHNIVGLISEGAAD
jgi:two-component system nitrate/nitrite response regulator NarL